MENGWIAPQYMVLEVKFDSEHEYAIPKVHTCAFSDLFRPFFGAEQNQSKKQSKSKKLFILTIGTNKLDNKILRLIE